MGLMKHLFSSVSLTDRQSHPLNRRIEQAIHECHLHNTNRAKAILAEFLPNESTDSALKLLKGIVALEERQLPEAIEALTFAAAAKPDTPTREFYLGIALEQNGNIEEALEQYEKVLQVNAKYFPAMNNLARLLVYKDFERAYQLCSQGLALAGNSPELNATMGYLLIHSGEAKKSINFFRKSLKLRPLPETHSGLIFALSCIETKVENILREDADWEKQFAKKPDWKKNQKHRPGKKIRLGYVSGDFRRHSVAFFFEPLIRCHDRGNFEIYCYSDLDTPDEVTARIRKFATAWRNICGMENLSVRKMIKQDKIDILVDLSGHTNGRRLLLFAERSAPVQISYLGYPGSSGISQIDFRIGDRYTDPEKLDYLFPEKIIRLPDGFWAYEPPKKSPKTGPMPCLNNKIFTFGSFNNQAKITPEVVNVWSEILQRNPNTRLLLKNSSLSSIKLRERFWSMFEKNGIRHDRVILRPFADTLSEHLETYHEVDVALDTFPYNGATTTFEALWMGVPVLTLVGERHASRVGNAIMSRLKMRDFVTGSDASYIKVACELPHQARELMKIRAGLRSRLNESPFCCPAKQTVALETAYRQALT